MIVCLERGADLHMAQLMPLPLTVCCFSKIQIGIGFTFLVPAHLCTCVVTEKGPLNGCVCVCVYLHAWSFVLVSVLCVVVPAAVVGLCVGITRLEGYGGDKS